MTLTLTINVGLYEVDSENSKFERLVKATERYQQSDQKASVQCISNGVRGCCLLNYVYYNCSHAFVLFCQIIKAQMYKMYQRSKGD